MPAPTGYYDVNRNAIARQLAASGNPEIDPNADPNSYAAIMNSLGTGGEPDTGTAWGPAKYMVNPNREPGRGPTLNGELQDNPIILGGQEVSAPWYAQQRGIDLAARPDASFEVGTPESVALVAGLPAALSSIGPSAASAGGGSSAGLSEVSVPSAGAYLPAESLSSAAAPTLGMTAPTAGGAEVGPGAGGGFDWQGMLKHANPFGGSVESGSPQYGDYSRIAEQLSRNQLQDQRKQVIAQQQAQGPSLQERRRQRIAALLQAGSPA